MMKRLLIANPDQFGYHTDSYQYCRYLQTSYEITYVCWDFGMRHFDEEGARVIYVSRRGGKVSRLARYIVRVLDEMKSGRFDITFVVYFPMCWLLALRKRATSTILDFRTGYVRESRVLRLINNMLMWFESLFFRNVTIISENLRRDLHIPAGKCHVLPLGAVDLHIADKQFTSMQLFYVGSLESRHIDDTVKGFSQFYRDMKGKMQMSYEIVGFGPPADEKRLIDAITAAACGDAIRFFGRVQNEELIPFLERNNIGVAYIPLKKHYQCQPATKVFEYLLAGMPVLATATKENTLVINQQNGVLVSDTPEDFCRGLQQIHARLSQYNSSAVKSNSQGYTWKTIVEGNLQPYLNSLVTQPDEPIKEADRKVA